MGSVDESRSFYSAPEHFDAVGERSPQGASRAGTPSYPDNDIFPGRAHDTSQISLRHNDRPTDGGSYAVHQRTSNPMSSVPYGGYEGPNIYDAVKGDNADAPLKKQKGPEGEYLAALRGSKSESWQNVGPAGADRFFQSMIPGASKPAGGAPGTCFKCNMEGHWSKDCPSQGGMGFASGGEMLGGGSPPDKACKCGAGICVVRTAKTEKNMGRQFYACPGAEQCGFFEWCDSPPAQGGGPGDSSADAPPLPCQCEGGQCKVKTSRTPKNPDRKFYVCPQDPSCGFFKWCDEAAMSLPPKRPFSAMSGGGAYGGGAAYGGGGARGAYGGGGGGGGGGGSQPDLPCPCGAGSCTMLTSKSQANPGRTFFKCPSRDASCNFFKWCDEVGSSPSKAEGVGRGGYGGGRGSGAAGVGAGAAGGRGGVTCFSCGEPGHVSTTCPNKGARGGGQSGGYGGGYGGGGYGGGGYGGGGYGGGYDT